MHSNVLLLWFLAATVQHASCFYNLCHSRKNAFLSEDECSELFFEPTEKETRLGWIDLRLENDTLTVTPRARSWNSAYLRITLYNNRSHSQCNKLTQGGPSRFCIEFAPDVRNDTFLLEYKAEKLPESSSRKFLMSLPQPEAFIFPFVDLTDTSRLVLKAQKLPTTTNVTFYKVEALKYKHNATRLLDVRFFRQSEDILYEILTYNDEGDYFFVITVFGEGCDENVCLRVSTPTVYLGRKSTRLVIGIVGASFILPFVLFLFHILTKKYPIEENSLEEGIMIAYKSSFKKHNDVVIALASLLERLFKSGQVEVVDLSKSVKRFPEKFCIDALITATKVVYVASPKGDSHTVTVDKALAQREILAVVFDHCSDKLPPSFENCKTFRLFEDFERLLQALSIGATTTYGDTALYADLRRKTEEARIETERNSGPDLPKIVVTVEEAQEHHSLIAAPEVIV